MTQEPGGNAAADAPPELHVVTHTHWDREWYHVAARFRQRLVTLIDQLLDSPPAGPFLLDGQSVALEDYLAVRPERAGELSSRMRQGRLEAGPWFVLPDELIPSGEALVRNLLAGRRVVRRLRANPPAVLYCPDSFGHPAALPAIAAGFGCSLIILWRGYGGRAWPAGDTVRWRAPSGEEALAWHLPPDGYEYGSSLPTEEHQARDRWNRLRPDVEERTRLGVVLLTNGADHHAVQVGLDDALMSLAFVASPWRVVRSSLTRFASSLERRAANTPLPVVTGEARDSYG
jgi:mannosylglycerate hydrolase